MKPPGIVSVEGFDKKLGFVRLGQQEEVGFDSRQLVASPLPESSRHPGSHVAAETVEVEAGQPTLEHPDHVIAKGGVVVVEVGDVGPVGIGRNDLSLRVAGVEVRMALHEHTVPRSVVGDDVDDDSHSPLMSVGDQMFEVVGRAVIRIDGVVVAHRVRAADRPLLFLLPGRMDGHEPEHGDAEVLQFAEPRGDSRKVSLGREVAGEDLIHHGIAHPVRAGSGWKAGHVAAGRLRG